MEVLGANFASEIRLLLRAQPGLVIAVIVLALLSGGVWFAGLRELWPLIALPAAAFAVYLPVHVEDRFLGGFVVVLFLTLLAAVQLRACRSKERWVCCHRRIYHNCVGDSGCDAPLRNASSRHRGLWP